jgi:uncharacterized protein (TIGR00661 family)
MKPPRILVCPLDWGLGHASRCVPVIDELLKEGADVVIAADNRPLEFLKKEFPSLEFIKFPGFNVRYPAKGNMVLKMASSTPDFLLKIISEHLRLRKISKQHHISGIISDNRFGLSHPKIPAVFITHQVNIISPILEKQVNILNRFFINRYQECWIPDNEGEDNISGKLSQRRVELPRIRYIGPLSRFKKAEEESESKYDIAAVLSGPEPQRTIFETKLIAALEKKALKSILIRGVTESEQWYRKGNLEIRSYADTKTLQSILESSELIITRPGYSTIMDLAALKKKAVFVPTPGQTEQEYLGKYLSDKGMGTLVDQESFNPETFFVQDKNIQPINFNSRSSLNKAVFDFLEGIKKRRD